MSEYKGVKTFVISVKMAVRDWTSLAVISCQNPRLWAEKKKFSKEKWRESLTAKNQSVVPDNIFHSTMADRKQLSLAFTEFLFLFFLLCFSREKLPTKVWSRLTSH